MHRRMMMAWFVVLFCYHICASETQRRNKALFPSSLRVKQGIMPSVSSLFQNTIQDANLLFEMLLMGLWVEDDRGPFCVQDEELASMRLARKLKAFARAVLPRNLSDIRRLNSKLSRRQRHLQRDDFERTVLTMVYTAHRAANATSHQRDAWAESFVTLYSAIKQDLMAS
ncbi:protein FAM180A-like [Scleropages formosus]|uniref:Protein FAM180A-like n=1 Tax=Scleropages formosus TaxID=113540 RepID=A0A8C9SDG3_SCLFO|nr:protein FAM180A-like [Scleropages formosus]